MLFKGWNPVLAPIIAAVLLMITQGIDPIAGLADTFLPGFNQLITMFLLFFIAASILGALYKTSGAAETIADQFYQWFAAKKEGRKKAVIGGILMVVICFVCCYGGLDSFCAIFLLLPVMMILARKTDVPRRLVPGLMFGGISAAQLGPGSPLSGNNFGSAFMGVSSTAAPVLGVIGMVFVLALILNYVRRSVGKAYDKGERYEIGTYRFPQEHDKETRPPFILAILPMLSIFVTNLILPLATGGAVTLELYQCLAIGDGLAIICFFPYMIKNAKKENAGKLFPAAWKVLRQTLGEGAHDGGNSILLIASASAFATVLSSTNGCQVLMNWVANLPLPLILAFSIAMVVLTFLTGTPGNFIIAAPIFLPLIAAIGATPDVYMRIGVFGQCVLDTLPINGAILIVHAQSGLSLKEGYPAVFRTTVIYMFLGTVLVTALAALFPTIW